MANNPGFRKMQQEVMRANGLKGAKKTVPGGKRDVKWFFIILGSFVGIVAASWLIPFIIDLFK